MLFLFAVPPVASMKFVRLSTLKALASNFILNRSVSLKFFVRLRSVCHIPGPTNVFRPKLPTQPRHGAERTGRLAWGVRFGWKDKQLATFQPHAHVVWLKLTKPGTLLLGRSFLPRVRR